MVQDRETTATALMWIWALLSQHPDVLRRLRVELDTVLGSRTPTFDDLHALPYSLMVIKEAMRLYPPIYFFGRLSITDVRLGGYDLGSGTVVLMSPWALHHRPEVWTDPERFDPAAKPFEVVLRLGVDPGRRGLFQVQERF